jgi:uncharacterized protein (DUF4415 family)
MTKVTNDIEKQISALEAMSDADIDYSDIPATTAKDWVGAVRGKFYRPLKQQLTVRIDSDVLAWLKRGGRGYQSRLNAILRTAMSATQPRQKSRRAK